MAIHRVRNAEHSFNVFPHSTIINGGNIRVGTGTKDSTLNGGHIDSGGIVGRRRAWIRWGDGREDCFAGAMVYLIAPNWDFYSQFAQDYGRVSIL